MFRVTVYEIDDVFPGIDEPYYIEIEGVDFDTEDEAFDYACDSGYLGHDKYEVRIEDDNGKVVTL